MRLNHHLVIHVDDLLHHYYVIHVILPLVHIKELGYALMHVMHGMKHVRMIILQWWNRMVVYDHVLMMINYASHYLL
jgi:hypothetical protein